MYLLTESQGLSPRPWFRISKKTAGLEYSLFHSFLLKQFFSPPPWLPHSEVRPVDLGWCFLVAAQQLPARHRQSYTCPSHTAAPWHFQPFSSPPRLCLLQHFQKLCARGMKLCLTPQSATIANLCYNFVCDFAVSSVAAPCSTRVIHEFQYTSTSSARIINRYNEQA